MNSAQPDAASQDEIYAANQQKGRAPRPTCSTSARPWRWPTQRCSRRTRSRRSTTSRRRSRTPTALGERLRRLHVDRLRLGQGAGRSRTSIDLLKPEFKGKVALNGDPTEAGAAFSGVMMVALSQAARPTTSPRRRLLRQAQGGRQLPAGRPDTGHHRVGPDPGRHRLGLPQRRGDHEGAELEGLVRPTTPWPATTSRRSTRTPRIRPPRGCGRSSCSATRARTCAGRRCPAGRADHMVTDGTSTRPPTRAAVDRRPGHGLRVRAERGGHEVPERQLGQGDRLTAPMAQHLSPTRPQRLPLLPFFASSVIFLVMPT